MKRVWFERALFISWYCSIGDCDYCYMSTQKNLIKNPLLARRRPESIYAEAAIARACGWKIEFISGGVGCCRPEEIVGIVKSVRNITGEKQWLNIGVVSRAGLERFGDAIEGVSGAVESVNPEVRKRACPSKPLEPILKMLDNASSLRIKKSITIIIGLGETERDIPALFELIKKHRIDRVTFYALNPHKGTPYSRGPATGYYVKWIRRTREEFRDLEIIAGSWVDRRSEIPLLLKSGADAFTKFPSIKLFGSQYSQEIESSLSEAGFSFEGTLTELPEWDDVLEVIAGMKWNGKFRDKVVSRAEAYYRRMQRHLGTDMNR